jgi:hypothetical protein
MLTINDICVDLGNFGIKYDPMFMVRFVAKTDAEKLKQLAKGSGQVSFKFNHREDVHTGNATISQTGSAESNEFILIASD